MTSGANCLFIRQFLSCAIFLLLALVLTTGSEEFSRQSVFTRGCEQSDSRCCVKGETGYSRGCHEKHLQLLELVNELVTKREL